MQKIITSKRVGIVIGILFFLSSFPVMSHSNGYYSRSEYTFWIDNDSEYKVKNVKWINGGEDVFITKDEVPFWMASKSKYEREARNEFKEAFAIRNFDKNKIWQVLIFTVGGAGGRGRTVTVINVQPSIEQVHVIFEEFLQMGDARLEGERLITTEAILGDEAMVEPHLWLKKTYIWKEGRFILTDQERTKKKYKYDPFLSELKLI